MPGKVIQCLKKTKTENPLILIDEVMFSKPVTQLFVNCMIEAIGICHRESHLIVRRCTRGFILKL